MHNIFNYYLGNVARRAFEDPVKLAEILEVDENLIINLQTILISLACQLPIDIPKFERLCDETAELYIDKYKWAPMTPTLHKILVHGADTLRNMPLPVGQMSEEAAEARNKILREYRLKHARRSSRLSNLEDVFHRLLDSSDPVVSSVYLEDRLQKKKHKVLPQRVQELLLLIEEDSNENIGLEYPDQLDAFFEQLDELELQTSPMDDSSNMEIE